jgi:hypothetical protein
VAATTQKPWSEPQLRDLIDMARDSINHRNIVLDGLRDMYLGRDWNAGTPSGEANVQVKTKLIASQIGTMWGMATSAKPRVRTSVASVAESAKKEAEQAENYLNNVFPTLEHQAGTSIWDSTFFDKYSLGFSWDAQDLYPARMTTDLELDTNDPQGYVKKRARIQKQRGTRMGKLPMHWRTGAPERLYFQESEEGSGLALAIEHRTRFLRDIVTNPKYDEGCPKLHAFYERVASDSKDKGGLDRLLVDFWIVESPKHTAYWVSGAAQEQPYLRGRYVSVATDLQGACPDGELADCDGNPLNRVRYVVDPCFRNTVDDEALKFYGLPHLMAPLAQRIDHWYGLRWKRAYQHSEAAWALTQDAVMLPGGEMGYAAEGESGASTTIEFKANEATLLPPGVKPMPIINPYESSEERAILMDLRNDLYAIGVNPTIFDQGSSGYSRALAINSTMAKFEPARNNTELAHMQRVLTHLAALRVYGEPLGIATSGKDHATEWYEANPKDWDDLELNMEPIYTLSPPEDLAANIQNATMLVQAGFANHEDAATTVLHIEDWQQRLRNMTAEQIANSPEVMQATQLDVLQEMQIAIADQQAQEQGDVSAQDFEGLPPEAANAFIQATPPGAPGYAAAQQLAGARQANPQGGPPTNGAPSPVGGIKGRAAGQKRRPGGPNKTGGLPRAGSG